MADRGFGRAVQPIDLDLHQPLAIDLSEFSTEDLEALLGIFEKYAPNTGELDEGREVPFARPPLETTRRRKW